MPESYQQPLPLPCTSLHSSALLSSPGLPRNSPLPGNNGMGGEQEQTFHGHDHLRKRFLQPMHETAPQSHFAVAPLPSCQSPPLVAGVKPLKGRIDKISQRFEESKENGVPIHLLGAKKHALTHNNRRSGVLQLQLPEWQCLEQLLPCTCKNVKMTWKS